jgi:hypothetical protein
VGREIKKNQSKTMVMVVLLWKNKPRHVEGNSEVTYEGIVVPQVVLFLVYLYYFFLSRSSNISAVWQLSTLPVTGQQI